MAKKKSKGKQPAQRSNGKEPMQKRSGNVGVIMGEALAESLGLNGYTPLDQNPEIIAGCRRIATLVSSMTLHLMENSKEGDKRIVNELSRKIDVEPWSLGTRKTWMEFIIMNLLIYGKGNSVVLPITQGGILQDLRPMPSNAVRFEADPLTGYKIYINSKEYRPDEVLHFVNNPHKNYPWKGQGLNTSLRDLARNLDQARETSKGFMESKWKPSVIIMVDANTDEFSSKKGRKALLEEYIETNEAGEPWIIPGEQFNIESVKPLSISDLAIPDTMTLDKKTVASILGVPTFVLGEGDFNADEWNNFINSTVKPLTDGIQQEMTKKLILNPKWYIRFNIRSLYAYDIEKLSKVGYEGYSRGVITGNEVRDWLGLNPMDGLDELIVLENYIPLEDVGNQKKLEKEKN